jgi:hypothetical protein
LLFLRGKKGVRIFNVAVVWLELFRRAGENIKNAVDRIREKTR